MKTPLGGIYTGGLVLLCLAFLMPYCAFIPKVSSVLLSVVEGLFNNVRQVLSNICKYLIVSKLSYNVTAPLIALFCKIIKVLDSGQF